MFLFSVLYSDEELTFSIEQSTFRSIHKLNDDQGRIELNGNLDHHSDKFQLAEMRLKRRILV